MIEEHKMDPLDYWVGKLNHFPVLAPIACDILAVPASTASVEWIFSSGGNATRGKRNRSEREIFIQRNKKCLLQIQNINYTCIAVTNWLDMLY